MNCYDTPTDTLRLPLKLDMSSKPVKSATKLRRPHNDPQADKESTRSGRERCPSRE